MIIPVLNMSNRLLLPIFTEATNGGLSGHRTIYHICQHDWLGQSGLEADSTLRSMRGLARNNALISSMSR